MKKSSMILSSMIKYSWYAIAKFHHSSTQMVNIQRRKALRSVKNESKPYHVIVSYLEVRYSGSLLLHRQMMTQCKENVTWLQEGDSNLRLTRLNEYWWELVGIGR